MCELQKVDHGQLFLLIHSRFIFHIRSYVKRTFCVLCRRINTCTALYFPPKVKINFSLSLSLSSISRALVFLLNFFSMFIFEYIFCVNIYFRFDSHYTLSCAHLNCLSVLVYGNGIFQRRMERRKFNLNFETVDLFFHALRYIMMFISVCLFCFVNILNFRSAKDILSVWPWSIRMLFHFCFAWWHINGWKQWKRAILKLIFDFYSCSNKRKVGLCERFGWQKCFQR